MAGKLQTVFLSLVLSCVGIFFALLVIEVGVRLYASRAAANASKGAWNDRPAFYYGAEGTSTLQDYPYPKEKPEDTFRVAVIGDSYAFAPYMQFTDTFSAKLHQMLNLGNSKARAEVMNFGVPAYSTSHEIEALKNALDYSPDLVLLQITLNDAELKPYRPTGLREDLDDPFGPFAPTGWKKTLFHYWKSAALVAERLHNTATHRAYRDYFYGLFANKRGRENFTASLQKMKKALRKRSIPFVAVIFPLFGHPLNDSYPFHDLENDISGILKGAHIRHTRIFEAYRNIPYERLQVWPGKDRHPNEIAHRIAAETIYLWLEQKDLIPESLRIKLRYKRRNGIKETPINPQYSAAAEKSR